MDKNTGNQMEIGVMLGRWDISFCDPRVFNIGQAYIPLLSISCIRRIHKYLVQRPNSATLILHPPKP